MLCIMAAWMVGWCTLAGGHTWTAVFTGPFLPWLLPGRVRSGGQVVRSESDPRASWRVPKLGRLRPSSASPWSSCWSSAGLFAAADPAFAHLVDNLRPRWNSTTAISSRARGRGIVVAFVLGGGYLMRFAPRLDALAPAPMRPVPRWEWAVPLGVLDVLFIVFVAVQATVLFGGHATCWRPRA